MGPRGVARRARTAPRGERSAGARARAGARVLGRRAGRARRDRVALACVGGSGTAAILARRGADPAVAGRPSLMTGPMQRIFRRRASGSQPRPRSGLFRRRSGADRLPWGKQAGATPPEPAAAAQTQTHVIEAPAPTVSF